MYMMVNFSLPTCGRLRVFKQAIRYDQPIKTFMWLFDLCLVWRRRRSSRKQFNSSIIVCLKELCMSKRCTPPGFHSKRWWPGLTIPLCHLSVGPGQPSIHPSIQAGGAQDILHSRFYHPGRQGPDPPGDTGTTMKHNECLAPPQRSFVGWPLLFFDFGGSPVDGDPQTLVGS